jgi:hypothetical protein
MFRPGFVLLAGVTLGFSLMPACGQKSPVEPSPVCSVAISPASQDFGADGGTGSVAITAPAGCAWTPAADRAWISLASTGAATGSGAVTYAVAANPSEETRSGTVTIAGQSHAVLQRGRPPIVCRPELSATSAAYGKDAATGSFDVVVAAGCDWTAVSSAPWLVVTGGTPGSGPGAVSYAVDRNLAPDARTATIVVADRIYTVAQSGDTGVCEYSVSPVQLNLCMPAGTVSATITTGTACSWTATPDASWVSVSGGTSGKGSGVIQLSVPDNYDAPRSARILVRWPTPTAGQNIRLDQAGCRYAVSRAELLFGADGGPGSFDVIQQSDPTSCGGPTQDRCIWSAVATVGWITVSGAMPRAGDNPVAFSVGPNPGTSSRTGTIAVRDKVVTITQAGRP